MRKVSWFAGILLQKLGTFHLMARRLLVSRISAPQITFLSTVNAHHRNFRTQIAIFSVSIATSSALIVLLGAISKTLIGWESVKL